MTQTLALHQFSPSLAYGDAISIHLLGIRNVLRRVMRSDIYYENVDPRMVEEGHYYWDFDAKGAAPDAAILYHHSIGSPVADYLYRRSEKLVINYHDLTPPEYFEPYDAMTAELLEQGRWQLEAFADRTRVAWADSEFAREDLEKAGYKHTAAIPILLDFERLDRASDAATTKWMRETAPSGPTILFVGRICPNKCQEDLIKLVKVYTELFEKPARVICVGTVPHRTERYADALKMLANELGVADRVTFTGSVQLSALRAYYRESDVFVSMSEHEGFNVPVVEAMHLGLPVVAYGAAAVPETVGSGGVILDRKDLVDFAVAVHRLTTDPDARAAVVEAGHERVKEFAPERVGEKLLQTITAHL